MIVDSPPLNERLNRQRIGRRAHADLTALASGHFMAVIIKYSYPIKSRRTANNGQPGFDDIAVLIEVIRRRFYDNRRGSLGLAKTLGQYRAEYINRLFLLLK